MPKTLKFLLSQTLVQYNFVFVRCLIPTPNHYEVVLHKRLSRLTRKVTRLFVALL